MYVLCFGDSLTSGENNDFKSYCNYLYHGTNFGVSGTTVGEYSIYPVDGDSLLSQLRRYRGDVKEADVIILEYGINDTSSVVMNNVTVDQVIISLIKAFDYIRQINPTCKIVWLTFESDIYQYASNHIDYLFDDYCSGYAQEIYPDKVECKQKYCTTYLRLKSFISSKCECIDVFSNDLLTKYLSSDNLHLTDAGYREVAAVINQYLSTLY